MAVSAVIAIVGVASAAYSASESSKTRKAAKSKAKKLRIKGEEVERKAASKERQAIMATQKRRAAIGAAGQRESILTSPRGVTGETVAGKSLLGE